MIAEQDITARSPRARKAPPAERIPEFVESLLAEAIECRASDVHVEPTRDGYELRFRVDGLLETVQILDKARGRAIVGRLMVMAQLLTYRQDVPQEGRAEIQMSGRAIALRVSVIPTVHGLRAAVRLPAELIQPRKLEDLGLPVEAFKGLKRFAVADSGLLILTGPAGSGKTTTIYALLEYIAGTTRGVSIVALEDPVERTLEGVTQIQVQPFGELTYERCLRSILRQDPQVLMLGEIRDAQTASLAIQAALSGHRLISTLHAGSAAGAIARLLEMGMEPYQITSAVWGVVGQRLLRKTCGDGYRGRVPVAELATMQRALIDKILARADVSDLQKVIVQQSQYRSMIQIAKRLIEQGVTDGSEMHRVLGDGDEA